MLIMEARELNEGDKVYRTGGTFEVITFLAGPWQNLNQHVWFITGRDSDGTVRLFNLNSLTASCPLPEEGDTWYDVHAVGSKYIIEEVTERFVIMRYDVGSAGHASPFVVALDKFHNNYRFSK
jgi:hypothetical protein